MDMTVERLDSGIKKIALRGKMDIEGTNQIDLRLSAETSVEKANVVIDLSDVDFMSSVGIGVLVRSYKTLKLRGGRLVLFNPQKVVELVLDRTLVNTLIPIFYDLQTACEQVMLERPD